MGNLGLGLFFGVELLVLMNFSSFWSFGIVFVDSKLWVTRLILLTGADHLMECSHRNQCINHFSLSYPMPIIFLSFQRSGVKQFLSRSMSFTRSSSRYGSH